MKLRRKNILAILIVIILLILVFVFYQKNSGTYSNFKLKDEQENITKAQTEINNVVGWLRVEGTNIDMVLIASMNQEILDKDDYQYAWTNSYPDSKSNHLFFISHNIRNVSRNPIVNDKNMNYFEQLMAFIYEDFTFKNQFIELTTKDGTTSMYRIYGVSLVDENQSLSYYDTFTKKEQKEYIKKAQKESMYDINVTVDQNDDLLTLYTCTRFYGGGGTYSFRVDARKMHKGEQMKYAKVKTNNNYQKIKKRMEKGVESNEKI